jgi:hypothetical protein
MAVTLGLFALYLIPSWGKPMARITGRPRLPAAAVRVLGVCSLGVALGVMQIAYSFQLAAHGRRVGHPQANAGLGAWVLMYSAFSVVWSVGTLGVGFLVGGFALGIHSVWLVQAELNKYADDGSVACESRA